jgi:cytochrome P450
MLRYDAPAQLVDRYVVENVTLPSGATLQRGDAISAVLGSANHDPGAFSHPDVFDITATRRNMHMGFGDGVHFCIGAPLARQVAPAAIAALLDALPTIELAGIPQWQTDPYLRGLNSLPLQIG